MNAQWWRKWNLGPRSHPNDGTVDVYEAQLKLSDLPKIHARLHHGSHLPHPRIKATRSAAVQVALPSPLPVALDGEVVGRFKDFSFRIQPDALTVVV
jgi:diacylglycerol kinase family enzyme